MKNEMLKPIHFGVILLEEFLKPMEITQSRLAEDIDLPIEQLDAIVAGTQAITPDIGARLSKYFGLSEHFWMNLQNHYELDIIG